MTLNGGYGRRITIKTITTFKNGKVREVQTPWLTTDDAADYCSISRTEFDRRGGKDIPHSGKLHRRYHIKTIDAWINGDLDIPFDGPAEELHRPLIRARSIAHVTGLTNPNTGKFVPCGPQTTKDAKKHKE